MSADLEDGYATPAAAVISLALAAVVAATMVRGISELRLAKAELAKTQAEYALEGAQNAALVAISTSSRPPPYRWRVASLGEAIDVVAEPERPKLSPQAAAADPTLLARLGAAPSTGAAARLAGMMASDPLPWVADQAPEASWRECAPAYISPFGAGVAAQPPVYNEPQSGQHPSLWRAGEVWRIQVQNREGWRDERIVRFTGNGLDPAAVIGRRLTRNLKGQQTCEALFDAASGA